MQTKTIKSLLTFLLFCFAATNICFAQKTLPDITVQTEGGINVISWINPYKSGIKVIKVERSVDSNYNFSVIGLVKDFNNNIQSYVDITPNAGKMWYRVTVIFTSDLEWTSNMTSVTLDSIDIVNRKQIKSVDTLQKEVNKIINEKGVNDTVAVIKTVEKKIEKIELPKSKFIFTNPFTGNINIELPEPRDYEYKVFFYTNDDKRAFDIPRIHEEEIILDKRNFQKTGVYKFKILKDNKEFEKGFITVYY